MDHWMLLAIVLVVYLLPAEMAASRGHYQRWTIFWLNLMLGWTLVGWIVALVWAATNPTRPVEAAILPLVQAPPPSAVDPVESQPQRAVRTDQCPNCGKAKEGSLSFCRHCGAAYS